LWFRATAGWREVSNFFLACVQTDDLVLAHNIRREIEKEVEKRGVKEKMAMFEMYVGQGRVR
jgi:hypothetical protein